MNKHISLSIPILFLASAIAQAQPTILWESYNDYRPTDRTHPNVTGYDLRVAGDGGVLRDFRTGNDLKASVEVVVEGNADPDNFGANSPVNAGSPADKLFGGKVDIGNEGLPGIRASASTKLILNFTGLDPTKRYNFRGTISRGGNYNDRWSVFSITGAESFVAAHEDGSANKNIITKAAFPAANLEPNQVALNSGDNKAGSLVGWDNIEPGPDGTFSIVAEQYTGASPFGNSSAAPYGYGLNAIYLAEVQAAGNLRITENPASQKVPAGTSATLKVVATSPQPIAYQWQKAAPGSADFTDINGATEATYTTPVLTVADDGAKFRVKLTSSGSTTTSGEAAINVDGVIPTISKVTGSINFNSVYITFSEPIKLEQLAYQANYSLSGGLTISSAVALDPTTVRLRTSNQSSGTGYTVTVSNVEDLAGNKVAPNSSAAFAAFTVQTGVVGLEVWRNIGGTSIASLRDSGRYPDDPDFDVVTTTFDSELLLPSAASNPGNLNTYGGRFRAWLTPEESGTYEFFIRADATGEVRISVDDKFDKFDDPNELPTAVDTSAGDSFQEPGVDDSVSAPIQLERGKRYAIQALWKESNIDDYLQVAWRKVGDTTPADQLKPIPSRLLSYNGPGAAPAPAPKITRVALQSGRFILEWTGGTLQSSSDLKTWSDEAGLSSPLSVIPTGAAKFYRVKGQ